MLHGQFFKITFFGTLIVCLTFTPTELECQEFRTMKSRDVICDKENDAMCLCADVMQFLESGMQGDTCRDSRGYSYPENGKIIIEIHSNSFGRQDIIFGKE